MRKKLLVLGGFPQMIDILAKAREMGIYTVVADREESSPAKRFADLSVNISTDDVDALERLCREQEIDGVFTGFEDFNIHIAQRLAERMHFPFYATKEQLDCVTNKLNFKAACRAYGVPVIEQYTLDAAKTLAKYPYIIKPADSYGSRGITVCRNVEELQNGYEKAIAVSPSAEAIVERFIDSDHGTELFYTVVDGSIHLTATADRYTVRNGETTVPLPVAEVFPSRHAAQMQQTLDGKIRDMLRGMRIQNGLILIQALYGDGEFFVYEMAYRLTGEQHYRMVAKQNGIDLSRMMIKLSLGESIAEFDTSLLDHDAFVYPSINYALILKSGKIAQIGGLERVYKIDEVISYNLTHAENDVIRVSGDYSHMLIRVNMVAQSYGKLCAAVKAINSYVTVTSDRGEDMLVTRFELPELK